MVHVRFEGRSYDLDLREVRNTETLSDGEVKQFVARQLDVSPERLRGYVVDRGPKGDLVVRPEAVYG